MSMIERHTDHSEGTIIVPVNLACVRFKYNGEQSPASEFELTFSIFLHWCTSDAPRIFPRN